MLLRSLFITSPYDILLYIKNFDYFVIDKDTNWDKTFGLLIYIIDLLIFIMCINTFFFK